MNRPLHNPLPAEVQNAMDVLNEYANREWEAKRQVREANARKKIADWLWHAENCATRAQNYEAEAREYPKSHQRYARSLELANRQWALHENAMKSIERIRSAL